MKKSIYLGVSAVGLIALTSCSTVYQGPINASNPNATFTPGVPGGVVVETHKVTATVTAVNPATREVTLMAKDGKTDTVTCGPDVLNFDQIHVGDVLKFNLTDEMTVAMADANNPPADSGSATVILAPVGAKPGGYVAATRTITATITGIDELHRMVSLQFPDGTTRTFVVRPDIDLSQRSLGEKIVIRVAAEMALTVEKP